MENDHSQTLEGGRRGRNKRAPERFRDEDESDPDEPRQYSEDMQGKDKSRDSDISDADDEEDKEEKNKEEDSVPSPRYVHKNTYATQQKSSPPPPLAGATATNTFGLAAAILRQFPQGVPQDIITEELMWQAKGNGTTAAVKTFREEVMLTQGLLVFAFLQPKDFTISLLHSPATYQARGGEGALVGKDIGFVGDRGEFSTPSTVVLHPDKSWQWISRSIHDDPLALEAHFEIYHNKMKPFKPHAKAEITTKKVPRLLLLPSSLVEFCSEKPRTPYDLYVKVTDMSTTGDLGYQHTELLVNWCMAACHVDNGKVKMAYPLEMAHDNNPSYQHWVTTRLAASLGPRVAANTAQLPRHQPSLPKPQDLQHLSVVAAEFGKGVLQALRPSASGPGMDTSYGRLAEDCTRRGDEGGKQYDKFHFAVIKGFSHCHELSSLQPIWGLFAQTKSFDTLRLTIKESMLSWSRRYNVAINRGIYLTKHEIDDFINLRFNPSGGVAYFNTAEKGMSILLCRSRAGDEREQATAHELAEGASSTNRTLAEALALGKRDPRPPPDTYHDLKAVVGTFCALLWTFFGDNCEYFKKCFEIYMCMDSDTVSEKWHFFTPSLCRQIVWAIINDGREYFSQTMLPSKFEVPPSAVRNIQYPISSLEELIRPIRTQSPIIHANFPSQWLPRARETPRATAYVGGDTAPPVQMVSHTSSTGATSVRSTTSSITGAVSTTPTNTTKHTIRQKDIHPVIKAAMLPYYSRVGRLQITRIMALADATWDDMPRLQKYVTNETNSLCYNYVLGKCNPKFCTHKSGHAAVADVTDDFANTVCTLLQPGLDDMTEAMAKMSWGEFKAMVAARPDKRQRTE